MRLGMSLCLVALISGCAYNRECSGPSPKGVVSVSRDSLEFSIIVPDGVQSVWVRYGTDINRMGATSEKSSVGRIRITKLKEKTVYYWQIVEQRACGAVLGRIYQNRTAYTAQVRLK